MDEDALLLLMIVILAIVGGFALAVAGFFETLGVPGEVTADIAAILFFGILLIGGFLLIQRL